jgi:hypothetical protein
MVFYDSTDLDLARDIARYIRSAGFTTWLADDDNKVNWRREVEKIASSNECAGAVVIWSKISKTNPTVSDESNEVIKNSKPLLGIILNGIAEAPLGLRDGPRLQFDTQETDSSRRQLETKIRDVFGDAGSKRKRGLILDKKELKAPSMVLSVSSFETQIEPSATLELLKLAKPPAILISAYDLLRPERVKTTSGRLSRKPKISDLSAIKDMRADGSVVLLDSGNYEAMRYKDDDWKGNKKRLLEAQSLIDVDLAFTHDSFPKEVAIEKASSSERVDVIAAEYQRDIALVNCAVAPIIHAPRVSGNRYLYERLPEICCGVVKAVNPKLIAVAERELGDGIIERVRTIAKIRIALEAQGSTTLLHVLGTGNPITMAFLSMAGADFFDGLEWCRTAIDGKRWRLYHFQQWDILASQSGLIKSRELAKLVNDNSGRVPWVTKVALHNIAFFMQASSDICGHHHRNEYEQLFTYQLDLENEYQTAKRVIQELG